MSRTDELRMMLRVAQLYYEDKLKQSEISQRLYVSQATVSRLLKACREGRGRSRHYRRATRNLSPI